MAKKCGGTSFQGKGDVRNCNTYRGVKLLEHAMKIVERVLERKIRNAKHCLSCEECNRNVGIRRKNCTRVLWI